MTDFARGGLIARLPLTGGEGPQNLYKASLDTEVTLLFVAVAANAQFSFYHDEAINPVTPTFDFGTALMQNLPVQQQFHGLILAGQGVGAALQVKRGQHLGAACDIAATVTLYGVTAGLGEIR